MYKKVSSKINGESYDFSNNEKFAQSPWFDGLIRYQNNSICELPCLYGSKTNGKCVCPPLMRLDTDGNCICIDPDADPTKYCLHCKKGYLNVNNRCIINNCYGGSIDPKDGHCVCDSNLIDMNGTCRCPVGFYYNRISNKCVLCNGVIDQLGNCICGNNLIKNSEGSCECAPDAYFNNYLNKCIYCKGTINDTGECDCSISGQTPSNLSGKCECPVTINGYPSYIFKDPSGKLVCRPCDGDVIPSGDGESSLCKCFSRSCPNSLGICDDLEICNQLGCENTNICGTGINTPLGCTYPSGGGGNSGGGNSGGGNGGGIPKPDCPGGFLINGVCYNLLNDKNDLRDIFGQLIEPPTVSASAFTGNKSNLKINQDDILSYPYDSTYPHNNLSSTSGIYNKLYPLTTIDTLPLLLKNKYINIQKNDTTYGNYLNNNPEAAFICDYIGNFNFISKYIPIKIDLTNPSIYSFKLWTTLIAQRDKLNKIYNFLFPMINTATLSANNFNPNNYKNNQTDSFFNSINSLPYSEGRLILYDHNIFPGETLYYSGLKLITTDDTGEPMITLGVNGILSTNYRPTEINEFLPDASNNSVDLRNCYNNTTTGNGSLFMYKRYKNITSQGGINNKLPENTSEKILNILKDYTQKPLKSTDNIDINYITPSSSKITIKDRDVYKTFAAGTVLIDLVNSYELVSGNLMEVLTDWTNFLTSNPYNYTNKSVAESKNTSNPYYNSPYILVDHNAFIHDVLINNFLTVQYPRTVYAFNNVGIIKNISNPLCKYGFNDVPNSCSTNTFSNSNNIYTSYSKGIDQIYAESSFFNEGVPCINIDKPAEYLSDIYFKNNPDPPGTSVINSFSLKELTVPGLLDFFNIIIPVAPDINSKAGSMLLGSQNYTFGGVVIDDIFNIKISADNDRLNPVPKNIAYMAIFNYIRYKNFYQLSTTNRGAGNTFYGVTLLGSSPFQNKRCLDQNKTYGYIVKIANYDDSLPGIISVKDCFILSNDTKVIFKEINIYPDIDISYNDSITTQFNNNRSIDFIFSSINEDIPIDSITLLFDENLNSECLLSISILNTDNETIFLTIIDSRVVNGKQYIIDV